MTLDVIDLFLLEILRPILWGASDLHFICAHGHHHGDLHRQSLENVFQAAGRFDASSSTDARSVGLQITAASNGHCSYGLETVRVPRGNAVQVIPAFFVGVSLPDIFFSRRSPLASAGGHGSNCDRTDVPYLEHDASHLTDSSLHSEPRERQQCKRNAKTKLPPVATKCKCTTTGHCFNLQVLHATMPSTTGALRSSCLLTSKRDTELQAETRCHDAVEPLPFPALLHGMRDKSCHTDTK